jgi:hypothetical protein
MRKSKKSKFQSPANASTASTGLDQQPTARTRTSIAVIDIHTVTNSSLWLCMWHDPSNALVTGTYYGYQGTRGMQGGDPLSLPLEPLLLFAEPSRRPQCQYQIYSYIYSLGSSKEFAGALPSLPLRELHCMYEDE